ncbi:hypothetical protein ACUXPL_002329 [Micrococcus sp. 140720015-1]
MSKQALTQCLTKLTQELTVGRTRLDRESSFRTPPTPRF